MLGLLLRSIIAKILILISHLQRLLSMSEVMSITFDQKMTVISAPNEILFQARYKLYKGIPSTDLLKKIPYNYCYLGAISTFERVLKNSLRTANLLSRGRKGAI